MTRGEDGEAGDQGFVKKVLSNKADAEALLGKTSIEVNILRESRCRDPATAVREVDDMVKVVGKIVQFSAKPTKSQVLASFEPRSPYKHASLNFQYGAHNVIQGIALGWFLCCNLTFVRAPA